MELNGSHAFPKTQQQSLFQEIMTQFLKTLPSAVSLCIAAQEKASTSNERLENAAAQGPRPGVDAGFLQLCGTEKKIVPSSNCSEQGV